MKKKYIVELEEGEQLYIHRYPEIQRIVGEPYTAPDLEKVRKEAYDKGYDKGYKDAVRNHDDLLLVTAARAKDEGREEGKKQAELNTWNAANKIWEYDTHTLKKIFGVNTRMDCYMKFTASEAIAKIKAWEEKKQEIKVGDEVDAPFGKAVVLDVCDNAIFYLYATGGSGWEEPEYVREHKTGRHFSEIVAVLEKMRRGRNE